MARTIARLFIIIVYCPLILTAQETSGSKISELEKRELEKKFEKLKTFYIADDGTVVYRMTEQDISTEDLPPAPQIKVKVSIDEEGEYIVTTEEINPEYMFEPVYTGEITGDIDESDNMYAEIKDTGHITIADTGSYTEENKEEEAADGIGEKKDVFKKKTSSYKSLEEAALAVDELLEELKKQQREQASSRGKNSLSQKAANGVDGSLRNGSYGLNGYNRSDIKNETYNMEFEEGQPTYFINGTLASKEEVDKIKSKDILKKVIKRSKSNPNGEWWIQTRSQ